MQKNEIAVTLDWLLSQGFSSTILSRFWAKVDKTSSPHGCWLWTAAKSSFGHGVIGRGNADAGNVLAHRLSWILHNGPIHDGLDVLHNCPGGDNPACVNADHLWPGTQIDNNRDMIKKGRFRGGCHHTGERNGNHKLTAEQVKEMREIYSRGKTSLRELAKTYAISKRLVFNIVHRKTWKHV